VGASFSICTSVHDADEGFVVVSVKRTQSLSPVFEDDRDSVIAVLFGGVSSSDGANSAKECCANSAASHAAHAGIALLHDQFVVVYGSLVDEGLLCAEEFVLGNEKPFLSPLNEIRPL
jgi:hypothetical protein